MKKTLITLILILISMGMNAQMKYTENKGIINGDIKEISTYDFSLNKNTNPVNASPLLLSAGVVCTIFGLSVMDRNINGSPTNSNVGMTNGNKLLFGIGALSFTVGFVLEIKN